MVVVVALWASHCLYTVQFSSSPTWCISASPKNLSSVEVITFYHYQHLREDNDWMMRRVLYAPEQWFSKCAQQIPRDP